MSDLASALIGGLLFNSFAFIALPLSLNKFPGSAWDISSALMQALVKDTLTAITWICVGTTFVQLTIAARLHKCPPRPDNPAQESSSQPGQHAMVAERESVAAVLNLLQHPAINASDVVK